MSQQGHETSITSQALRIHSGWFILLLLFMGMAAYYNSFTGAWVFDDFSYIHENRDVRDLWTVGSGYPHPYRPVLQWTFSLNYALGGLNPFGYHLFNIIVHLLAGLTLFGIVRRTFSSPRLRTTFGVHADYLAWTIAVLWLVHPLQTESVTYISQRSESLMGLLFFLGLYGLIRGTYAGRPLSAWSWYSLGCLVFALGCGTKEVTAAGLGVFLLYDRSFLASSWDEVHTRRWLFYLGCLAGLAWLFLEAVSIRIAPDRAGSGFHISSTDLIAGLVGLGLVSQLYRRLDRTGVGGGTIRWIRGGLVIGSLALLLGCMTVILIPMLTRMGGYARISGSEYALTQTEVIIHYLRLVFWPSPLSLDHAWPVASTMQDILGPALVIGAVIMGTLWSFRRRSAWAFPCAAFFIMLLPTSSIIPLRDVAVEHRMYIPLAAVIAVVVLASYTGLNRLWAAKTWRQTAQAMTAVVIILILCGGTIVRNMDYKSPITLWTQVVSLYPDHKRAHLNLAQAHTQAGTHEDALLHYQKSLPFDWLREGLAARYYYNFGLSLQAMKQNDAAEATYREAIKHAPRHLAAATSYNQLGLIAIERKDNRRALQYFKASTRVAPYYAIGYKNLGILYARMDRLKLAQQSLHQAVRVNPDFVEAHFALAEVFEQQALYHLAAASYQTVMRLDPDYPDVQNRMGERKAVK